MSRTAEIILDFQNYIESPPIQPQQLYANAASSDQVTIDSWRKTWISNIEANKKFLGSFKDHSLGQLHGSEKLKTAIIAGSGPSLKVNAHLLKDRGGIPLISCLHNFHFMEDIGAAPEYYVSLDAGPVVLEEIAEGGSKSEDEYWAMTKDRTLIAYIGSDPRLFQKWQGKILVFNAPVPEKAFMEAVEQIEKFNVFVSNGGNVLGACLYIAKGFLGANPIAFIGADFAFSYDRKFHGWDSKYDKSLGYVLKAVDVYGNKVLTWQSYANFKAWFDWVALKIPGIYINCTEGGTFGAYPEGNLMAIKQMELSALIAMCKMHEELKDQSENSETEEKKILF